MCTTNTKTRAAVGIAVMAMGSGCMPAVGPPAPPGLSPHVVMTDAPESTALSESRGAVYVRHQGDVPLFGPVVCKGAPCDAHVVANEYLIASSPDFPPSQAVKVPPAPEIRATVKPGAKWKNDLVLPLAILDAFALAGGGLLVADTSTQRNGSATSTTTTHPDLALGVASLVVGTAGSILTYMLWRDSKTRLSFITPDGVVHF